MKNFFIHLLSFALLTQNFALAGRNPAYLKAKKPSPVEMRIKQATDQLRKDLKRGNEAAILKNLKAFYLNAKNSPGTEEKWLTDLKNFGFEKTTTFFAH